MNVCALLYFARATWNPPFKNPGSGTVHVTQLSYCTIVSKSNCMHDTVSKRPSHDIINAALSWVVV